MSNSGAHLVQAQAELQTEPRFNQTTSAAALTRAALGANTAGAGSDHFVTAAVRTNNVHEHVAERFLHAIGMTLAIPRYLRLTVVRRMARNHVDQFFFARPRQIRTRTLQRLAFLFYLHILRILRV